MGHIIGDGWFFCIDKTYWKKQVSHIMCVVEKKYFQTKKSFQMEFCDFYWVGWMDGWQRETSCSLNYSIKSLSVITTTEWKIYVFIWYLGESGCKGYNKNLSKRLVVLTTVQKVSR
jgi:hypothetical protein